MGPFLAAGGFLGLMAVGAWSGNVPLPVLVACLVFSAASYIAYAIDKSAAQNQRWRTPESTLHLLALAGGWPGALVAQQVLRHKTKKASFRMVFWLTVVLNCALAGWLVSPAGSALLRGIS